MNKKLIKNATIVNEGREFVGSVLIDGERIEKIYEGEFPEALSRECDCINATGLLLFPGVIDDQVHFREPGLTHKGDLFSETRAAAAGGDAPLGDAPRHEDISQGRARLLFRCWQAQPHGDVPPRTT